VLGEVIFWAAIAIVAWVYAGYPALVALLARVAPLRPDRNLPPPSVSVAIVAHNEAAHIRDRIRNVLAQDPGGGLIAEVLVGSDGSKDRTDEIVAGVARHEPRVRLLALPRAGTTPTQHAMFEAAQGDVVLLTDAETRFKAGCVAAVAEAFRDGRVGCATGRLEWFSEDSTATSRNEGLYWRYERRVRAMESRAGFLTAGTGAVLAVRRSSYRAVTTTTGMDHLLPLFVIEQGQRVVFVGDAVASDRPISGLREQFRNRTRTATRGIEANLSMVGRLAPWRHPRAAVALWSHKLLRWATPWLVLAAVGSAAVLGGSGQPGYLIVPFLAMAGIGAAVLAHAISRAGRKPPGLLALPRAFGVVCLSFAVAWINVVRGRRIESWHRADWESA
jgi:cellulose synthase/poly-beta-1,6-N-acetylglucosamine synthase-like glycosyltransferase